MPHQIAIIAVLLILIVVTARREKRLVWAYGNFQPEPHFGDPSGYGLRWVAEAIQEGFTFLGWAPDLKGSKYRVSYAMLISPDRATIAIIGVGMVQNIPVQGTWLHTPAIDGRRSWYSTDNQACVEIDISHCWKSQLVRVPRFGSLWHRHSEWIQRAGVTPRGLQPSHEVEDFRQLREDHFRSMARQRLISFTDSDESYWRYTMYGALKIAALSYPVGLLRALTFGRLPRSA